jgi:hypothetical protein
MFERYVNEIPSAFASFRQILIDRPSEEISPARVMFPTYPFLTKTHRVDINTTAKGALQSDSLLVL